MVQHAHGKRSKKLKNQEKWGKYERAESQKNQSVDNFTRSD